jgi:oligopeptide transport system substrate-binding protein
LTETPVKTAIPANPGRLPQIFPAIRARETLVLPPTMTRRALFLLPALLCLAGCQRETQVEKANREGILIFGNSNEPKGLDSQVVTGVLESNILRALFEGLVSDHPSDDAGIVPGGAETLEPDATATVWIAKLRPNAKWSDGAPVTAQFILSVE